MRQLALNAQRPPLGAAVACLLWLLSGLAGAAALANAGKVMFVAGRVSAEHQGTAVRELAAGDAVQVGDTVITADKSRAQLMLDDGQRIALRAGSRFRIDGFSLPAAVQNPGASATAVQAAGESLFTLQKGGLRTRTGASGRTEATAYQLRTPVGTLGIRGTDYTAVLCRGDCDDAPGAAATQPVRDGLYLGVDQGRIVFRGRGVEIELGAGEFAFIPLDQGSIERLRDPPALLRGDGAGRFDLAGAGPRQPATRSAKLAGFNDRRDPVADTPPRDNAAIVRDKPADNGVTLAIAATSLAGTVVDLTPGALPLRRGVAFAYGGSPPGFASAGYAVSPAFAADVNGNLSAFTGPFGSTGSFLDGNGAALSSYSIGTAANADSGNSIATGIRWGRWSGGTASVTLPGNPLSQALNLSQQSLPWILGSEQRDLVLLPISGAASFGLVGGTRPTNTFGAVGALGNVFITANFTNLTVVSAVTLDLGGVSWFATGNGVIGRGGFSGNFSSVTVGQLVSGSGAFSGFFVDPAAAGAAPRGAGLSYVLAEPLNQFGIVTGVAALQLGVGNAPNAPAPPQRDVAWSIARLGQASNVDAVTRATAASYGFTAGVLSRGPGVLQRGIAAASGVFDSANGGAAITSASDVATGLQWGRWSGGSVSVPDGNGGTLAQSLASQSLHYIIGPAFGAAPALPVSGTRNYVLLGATAPSDISGNVGVFGGAAANADFTNRTVTTTLSLAVNGTSWYATATTRLAANSSQFSGPFNVVRVGGVLFGSGNLSGFFVEPAYGGATAPGLGVSYSLVEPLNELGTISGAVALRVGNGAVAVPSTRRDFAYSLGATGGVTPVLPNAVVDYDLDASLDSSRFAGLYPGRGAAGVPVLAAASLRIGTASVVNSGADARANLRWGRWSGGSMQVVDAQGVSSAVDLSTNSLHYIMSGDAVAAPVLPVAGTQRYALVGSTSPTNDLGTAGVVGAASLAADFTAQLVTLNLQADVGVGLAAQSWQASGTAPLLAASSQFSGALSGTLLQPQAPQLNTTGQFSGFFSGPPAGPLGAPQGAGVSFSLAEPQTQSLLNGVLAFTQLTLPP